jgi:5'-nucleotidase
MPWRWLFWASSSVPSTWSWRASTGGPIWATADGVEDVTYSGTVTAAADGVEVMEGVIAGVPAIAVSLNSRTSNDFGVAGHFAARLARQVLARGLPEGVGLPEDVLLNANVPPLPANRVAGVLVTRMGLRI